MSPTDPVADPRTRRTAEKALRLGVLYADGRRASTVSRYSETGGGAGGEHLTFLEVGRGGTDRQWNADFWVHPLPPHGPVTFVACSAILEAAGRAVTLWPGEPDDTARGEWLPGSAENQIPWRACGNGGEVGVRISSPCGSGRG